MSTLNLIILSYHKFVDQENDYPFSRTYNQFWHDLRKKEFDWVTIDDCLKGQIKACEMMRELNIRAKLFACASLIGTDGYCTWEDLKELSKWHDIECHAYHHKILTEFTDDALWLDIDCCVDFIKYHIGKRPRFFVAPFNQYDERVERIAGELRLQLVKDRITIKNDSK